MAFELFAEDIVFGEGMRWRDGRVWMSDMLARRIYTYTEDGARTQVAEVPERPNGLAFLPEGDLLTTSMADQKLYRVSGEGILSLYADPSHLMTGYCGDLAVDGRGNAFLDDVGFRVFEGDAFRAGKLILVRPDGSCSVQDDDLHFANGCWVTEDQKYLILAETRRMTIWRYTIGADGTLSDKTVFAEPGERIDGITLDSEGAVWACLPHARKIARIRDGGEIVEEHDFGDDMPVALCLGGDDLKTLYVVAADFTLERMARNDTDARIYRKRVDVAGFQLP